VLHFLWMRRRSLLQLISVGALSPGFDALRAMEVCRAIHAGPAEAYQLRFFRPDENELLDALMEMIIPADAHSPGAREAKVSLFADWMVSHDPAAIQQEWRTGLQRMNEEARNMSRADVLAKAAAGEAHPESDLDRFFIRLKQMTVDGYYTSEIGLHQDLQYQGNEHLLSFPACTHAEHKA
jgi:hypothetical protein